MGGGGFHPPLVFLCPNTKLGRAEGPGFRDFYFYYILHILCKFGVPLMHRRKVIGFLSEIDPIFPIFLYISILTVKYENWHNFRLNGANDFIFAP